jgi:pyruvate/2-oxoacid:ferredoxin oxidoreductase alpha subunit
MVVIGGGHGNYRNIVLAPNSGQEMCDFTYSAFELAERYRVCVFILSDAYIGQMMEPVRFPAKVLRSNRHDWALYADAESRHNLITSIYMSAMLQGNHNIHLQEKYQRIAEETTDWEEIHTEDAETLIVAFGITSRIALTAVTSLRKEGLPVGLLRPKTLFPFPEKRIRELAPRLQHIIVAELNNGQMAADVRLSVDGGTPVLQYNWYGGMVPKTEELAERIRKDCYGKA